MIQFLHRNKQVPKGHKKTFAFKISGAEEIFKGIDKLLGGSETLFDLEVGISSVHWKDNYNKKLGRKMTTERLKKKTFKIVNVSFIEPTKIDLVLVATDDSMALKVGLSPGKDTARVLGIQLSTDE